MLIFSALFQYWHHQVNFTMENKNSSTNEYKDGLENSEIEKGLEKYKYKFQDEDINFQFVEERSEMQCTECKVIRDTRDKFLNHLNSRRHLKIIEISRKR